MMNSFNGIGRLVACPELRKTPNGVSVTTITIACERDYKGKDGTRQTDFIDCVAYRGTAEFLEKWFDKGQMVAITGSLQTRMYEDKEGKKRKVYEIVAEKVNFCGDKSNGRQAHTEGKSAPPFPANNDDDFAVIDSEEDYPF